MVHTRNQAANAPRAEPLVSIPTIYRPRTPGGGRIVEPMPGTRAQPSNGEQMRVTRAGRHYEPILSRTRRTTFSAEDAITYDTASNEQSQQDAVSRPGTQPDGTPDEEAVTDAALILDQPQQNDVSPSGSQPDATPDDEPDFELSDYTFDQDPDLPSNLNFGSDDHRREQWREDLLLEPFMDPFLGELVREADQREKMKKAQEEEAHKQIVENLSEMKITIPKK